MGQKWGKDAWVRNRRRGRGKQAEVGVRGEGEGGSRRGEVRNRRKG